MQACLESSSTTSRPLVSSKDLEKRTIYVISQAPLKNSERKKLRQRVLQDFGLGESTELGDTLVPEGLQSIKFTAHNAEPGVCTEVQPRLWNLA